MVDSDVQMPMFGRAGNAPAAANNWNEVDNFDVDVLADYLLDDGGFTAGGITFDFAIDPTANAPQTMVSPENSEDGNLPPVADTSGAYLLPEPMRVAATGNAMQMPQQQQQQGSLAFPTLPAEVPATAAGLDPLHIHHHQHQHQHPGFEDPVAKRPRLDGQQQQQQQGSMAALAAQVGSPILSRQQLAAAAAEQAMQQQGRGRKKNQAQVDRRRERNRILARRTRLRKKFFFESLQKEVMDLQAENLMLKDLVRENVAEEHSKPLLAECDALEKLPPDVFEACGETDMESKDFNLVKSIQVSQHSFIITDPSLQDNPIVFASEGFLTVTGYSREQVLGRNCRFLQGPDTDKAKVDSIKRGLAAGDDVSCTLLNYTADGTPFWNKLFIAALRDAQDNIVNYIGVLAKVAAPPQEDPEHEKALPAVKKAAAAAESTVKAIEGAVTAAVAAAATAGGPSS